MKEFETVLGLIRLTDARMTKKSGYGQYTLEIYLEIDGTEVVLKEHTTDSQSYDKAHGEDNHSEIVMNEFEYTIDQAVEDYASSFIS